MTNPMQEERPAVVKVFRESPHWDDHERWFTMPTPLLEELFLDWWTCPEEVVTLADVSFIRQQYDFPVCLVYIGAPITAAPR